MTLHPVQAWFMRPTMGLKHGVAMPAESHYMQLMQCVRHVFVLAADGSSNGSAAAPDAPPAAGVA